MANQPWKQDNWFVSPWNFVDEVRKDLNFAKNIKVHDVTLRDGEQQTGVILSKDEKIRIAEALAEAGVHRIEAGMPIVSPSDAEAIKTASSIWTRINLVNLHENIIPTRQRSDLILKKVESHQVEEVSLRRL